MRWVERRPSAALRALVPDVRLWTRTVHDGTLSVLVSVEDGRWHLSIDHDWRYPKWEEIKEARYELMPDAMTVAMLLPPAAEYVNVHPRTFHLWQIADDA